MKRMDENLALAPWISEREDSITDRKVDESQASISERDEKERGLELVFIHLNFHPNQVDENSSCSGLD
jgi:hypothetical protein